METRRLILLSILALIGYNLWVNWQNDYPQVPVEINQPLMPIKDGVNLEQHAIPLPSTFKGGIEAPKSSSTERSSHEHPTAIGSRQIEVETDVLRLKLDLNHGDITEAALLGYPESQNTPDKPILLLQSNAQQSYLAKSNLFEVEADKVRPIDFNFKTAESHYRLLPDQQQLAVTLEGQTPDGIRVLKTYTFQRGKYLIDVTYTIENTASQDWKGYLNTQLQRTTPPEEKTSIFQIGSYTGASYSNPGHKRFQKVSFPSMKKENLDSRVKGGWIAMQEHYFLSAWIPHKNTENTFYTRAVQEQYSIGTVSNPIEIAPGKVEKLQAQLYLGPEITSNLKAIAPGLDLTIDYGWLWWLSSALFSVMKALYHVVGNWGWVIVLVTLLIKLVFYRLSATSYRSMAGMRKLQPKIQALRERYGSDKAKLSQATMELYRQEKVNPLNGCLPVLIQVPVFIALYWVLLESVELRQAPFIFWIKDLSVLDPYHVLPILMGITMLIQQKLNPAPPDPTQAKVMMFLPLLFTALFWNFPAGLVLYWAVNNTLSILQQWYITRKYSQEDNFIPAKSKKSLSRK